jgi:hypothetical protein
LKALIDSSLGSCSGPRSMVSAVACRVLLVNCFRGRGDRNDGSSFSAGAYHVDFRTIVLCSIAVVWFQIDEKVRYPRGVSRQSRQVGTLKYRFPGLAKGSLPSS